MLKSKKGVSGVVTVVILVALVLVAIGVMWGVVSNLLKEESRIVESQSSCLDMNIRPVSASCDGSGNCDVTVRRAAGGDSLQGLKIVYHNGSDYSGVQTEETSIDELESYTTSSYTTGLTDPILVEVTPYILDSSNKDVICDGQSTDLRIP